MNQVRKVLAITLALLFFGSSLAVGADPVPANFVISGSGYGHGVGLSQIGARGQALAGKSAAEILSYYFPGASVAPVDDSALIRVNVGHQLKSATIAVDKAITKDSSFQLIAGSATQGTPISFATAPSVGVYDQRASLKFSIVGKQVKAVVAGAGIASPIITVGDIFTVRWPGTDSFDGPPSGIVISGVAAGIRLRYGQVRVSAVAVTGVGYRLEISDSLAVHDEYLYGVSEVSSSWPLAALESQVIASRTYALARLGKIKKDCDCQVYNTKYDQNYVGYAKEDEARYGKLWVSAVDESTIDPTHSLAILYKGKPINVYFFSSSGGATQRSLDVWGTAFPYLTNVPDPWSLDPTLNPKYAHWDRTITQAVMAAAFGLPDVVRYQVTSRTATNSVKAVKGFSSDGTAKTLSVSDFKTRVKLPSSWFDLPTPTPTPTPTAS